MTKNGNSLHRPYEIIETEETVTRYFKPSQSKVPTNSSNNHLPTEAPYRHNEPNSFEQNYSKIAKNDDQLQALYEKFNKLRTAMSELTEKFKEINLAKSNLPPPINGLDIRGVTDFSSTSCQKAKSNEYLMDSDDAIEDSRDYKSPVSVDTPTERHQKRTSNQQIIDDAEVEGHQTAFSIDNYPKRVDALLLKRSKTLLIRLIDKELQRLQPAQDTCVPEKSNPLPSDNSKHLKMECIGRIGEELTVLRNLEVIDGAIDASSS